MNVTLTLDLSPAFAKAIADIINATIEATSTRWTAEPPGAAAAIEPAAAPDENGYGTQTTPRAVAATEPATAQVEAPRWTDDRHAVLDFYYPAGDALPDILARLNACPGQAVSYDEMKAKIISRKLKREDAAAAPTSGGVPAAAAVDDVTIRHWAAARGLCNGGAPMTCSGSIGSASNWDCRRSCGPRA